MAEIYRKTAPGRYGTFPVYVRSSPGANPLTANTTTRIRLGGLGRRCRFLRLTSCQSTLAADADGAVLAHVSKFESDGTTVRVLSADLNLETQTVDVPSSVGVYTSAAEKHLVIKANEQLLIDVVNDSAAINTQPVNLLFTIELALLD